MQEREQQQECPLGLMQRGNPKTMATCGWQCTCWSIVYQISPQRPETVLHPEPDAPADAKRSYQEG